MKIDIISDVACPWCYVGKKNLEAAMAQRPDIDFEIQWFPYQLHPEAPAEGYAYQEVIEKKYGKARVDMMFQQLTQTGAAAGIQFKLEKIKRGANTLQAHRLLDLAWQQGVQNELAEVLFKAYFCDGLFVGDDAVLAKLASEVGMDSREVSDYLASDAGSDLVQKQIAFARQNGVTGVPSFSFDGVFAISGGQAVDVFVSMIDRIQDKSQANAS